MYWALVNVMAIWQHRPSYKYIISNYINCKGFCRQPEGASQKSKLTRQQFINSSVNSTTFLYYYTSTSTFYYFCYAPTGDGLTA